MASRIVVTAHQRTGLPARLHAVGAIRVVQVLAEISPILDRPPCVEQAARRMRRPGRLGLVPTTDLIAPHLTEFATACVEALPRAHARTGDPAAIDSYIGKGPKFAAAMSRFAQLYADQNERDHTRVVSAIAADAVEDLPG